VYSSIAATSLITHRNGCIVCLVSYLVAQCRQLFVFATIWVHFKDYLADYELPNFDYYFRKIERELNIQYTLNYTNRKFE